MKRKSVRFSITFGILAICAFAGFPYFRSAQAERAFSHGIAAAVRSGQPTIHFRTISSPDWERVYIFGPYTYPEQISAALGFTWHGSDVDTINSSDGVNLLVFVRQQRVVMSVLHPRNEGDFVPASVGYNYSPDDAEFALVRRFEDNWLLLTPVPNSRKPPDE